MPVVEIPSWGGPGPSGKQLWIDNFDATKYPGPGTDLVLYQFMQNYIPIFSQGSSPDTLPGVGLGAFSRQFGTNAVTPVPASGWLQLTIAGLAGLQEHVNMCYVPSALGGPTLSGKSQFVEAKWLTDDSTAGNQQIITGLSCFTNPGTWNASNILSGYFLLTRKLSNICILYSGWPNAPSTSGAANLGTIPFVLGDTIRMEVVPGSGQNTITCYQNGVQQLQVVDAPIHGVSQSGVPGIALWYQIQPHVATITNFKAGSL